MNRTKDGSWEQKAAENISARLENFVDDFDQHIYIYIQIQNSQKPHFFPRNNWTIFMQFEESLGESSIFLAESRMRPRFLSFFLLLSWTISLGTRSSFYFSCVWLICRGGCFAFSSWIKGNGISRGETKKVCFCFYESYIFIFSWYYPSPFVHPDFFSDSYISQYPSSIELPSPKLSQRERGYFEDSYPSILNVQLMAE